MIDQEYIVRVRRELHKIPELGFDLPKTLSFLRAELEALGISYTEKYGKSSIVATIGAGKGSKTLGLRADIDALPIEEKTGLPFSSLHEGKMHACGHDCHAAILLGVGKALKEMEDELKCCVKLVFQSAEEGPGGAKLMCDDGLMDEIDMIIGCHIAPQYPSGTVRTNQTCMNASSHGFRIILHGRSCHVARPHQGIDAIAMANRVYTAIQVMRAREINPLTPVVIGIGEIHGGNANNIVCDEVMMHGTIRALSPEVDEFAFRRIQEISENIAREMGGSAEVVTTKHYPCLINDKGLAQYIEDTTKRLFGEDAFQERDISMGAEDFAYYSLYKPAAMYSFGCQVGDGAYPLHNAKMMVDETYLHRSAQLMVQFILDYME